MTDLPILGTSERSAFRRCPQRWWWTYRMGLIPKHESGDALWFGIGVHLALAQWYQKGKWRGKHPADFFYAWVGEEINYIAASREEWEDRPKYEEAADLGVAMLEGYVEEYGKDPSWDVVATEQSFSVKVTRGGVPIAVFASTFDLVYRDLIDGRLYLGEHKTASQISTAYLELDDQAGAYWAVAGPILRAKGILRPGEEIAGIQYNFLRKAMPDERPQNEGGAYLNKDGTVSKKQPAPRFVRPAPVERFPVEQRIQLERMSDEVLIMNKMRSGELPVFKNTNRDCTFCPFFAMCKLHEQGGEAWKTVMRNDFIQQDPYADKRKAA